MKKKFAAMFVALALMLQCVAFAAIPETGTADSDFIITPVTGAIVDGQQVYAVDFRIKGVAGNSLAVAIAVDLDQYTWVRQNVNTGAYSALTSANLAAVTGAGFADYPGTSAIKSYNLFDMVDPEDGETPVYDFYSIGKFNNGSSKVRIDADTNIAYLKCEIERDQNNLGGATYTELTRVYGWWFAPKAGATLTSDGIRLMGHEETNYTFDVFIASPDNVGYIYKGSNHNDALTYRFTGGTIEGVKITGESSANTTDLTSAAVAPITAPVKDGTVPTSANVTYTVAEGSVAPAAGTAAITWTKGGNVYSAGTFDAYSTEYTAAYSVEIPEGYAWAAGTALTVDGVTVTPTSTTGPVTFTKAYTTPAAATAGEPVINTQPQGGTITAGGSHTLTVGATSPDGGELSYQWFSKLGSANAVAIADSNKASIQVSPTEMTSYYCEVTNTKSGATTTTNSSTVTVTVNPAITTIDSIALGLTAPVAGAQATEAATSTTGVTVSSTNWAPALTGNTFAYGTTYTATIAVSAESNYEIASNAAVTGLTGATYANGDVTVTFAATETAVDAEAPAISAGQPADVTLTNGDTAALTVSASVSDSGTLSFQWYEAANTTAAPENDTAITADETYTIDEGTPGTSVLSFTPANDSTGYYYCVVTNNNNVATGEKNAATTSRVALVSAAAEPPIAPVAPTISTQPAANSSVEQNEALTLSVVASSAQGTLTYQWYSNTTASNAGGSVMMGDENASLTVDTSAIGTAYYYCVVTNTDNAATTEIKTSSVSSQVAKVAVTAKAPEAITGSVAIAGETAVGSVLTATVTGLNNGAVAKYQWKSGSTNVGADSATYTTVDSDAGKAIACVVTAEGFTGSLPSNTITVDGVSEEEVKPEFPNIPDAKPDAGNKVYTSEIKSSEEGSPVMGTITLRRADGQSFTLAGTVPADTVFTLTAEPKEGYKFSGWNKATARMALFAEGGLDLSQPTVSGTYSELAQLSATFALKDAPAVGNPTLRALQLSGMPQNRALIQTDGAYTQGFSGTETSYELYFLPGETIGFTLTPVVSVAGNYTVAINGGTPETFTASGSNGTVAGNPVAVTGTADTAITVVITDTDSGKSTTYNISPKVNLPQAKFELSDQTGGTKVSELSMTLTGTYFDVAEFSIKLKDLTSYQGFATSAGVLLDKDSELKAVADAITSGLKNFEVDSLTVDSTTDTLTIRITSKTGTPASGDNETLKLYLLQAATGYTSAVDGVKTLASDVTSRMDDVRYVAVINNGLNAPETSLVYLVAASANWELYAYANKEGNNAGVIRVSYVIKVVNGDVKTEIANGSTGNLDAYGGLSVLVNNGTYEITFAADGYKTTAKTVEVKDAAKGIPAFMLLAGDVNGDGTINDVDRQALMAVYGEIAANGKTTTGDIKADFNDDGVVDIFDLGALLRNQGK